MIKIALKHFIYEKCIDTLFNAIFRNFSVIKKGGTEKLHPYFLDMANNGMIYGSDSLEYMQYRNIFNKHAYWAGSRWMVNSAAVDDLVLYGCKLNARLKQDPTYARNYGPFD